MPIFEYICEQCDHEFEAIIYGSQKAECPKCHGQRLTPQLSLFAVSCRSSSSGPMQAPGPCGACGDERGPGACSMPDLD